MVLPEQPWMGWSHSSRLLPYSWRMDLLASFHFPPVINQFSPKIEMNNKRIHKNPCFNPLNHGLLSEPYQMGGGAVTKSLERSNPWMYENEQLIKMNFMYQFCSMMSTSWYSMSSKNSSNHIFTGPFNYMFFREAAKKVIFLVARQLRGEGGKTLATKKK